MIKILKNQLGTSLPIADTGISLPASPATYEIPPQDYLLWAASVDIVSSVLLGDVVVNNGLVDLSPVDGLRFLEYPDRLTVKKDNTTVTEVVTEMNFTGNVNVTTGIDGKTNVDVISGASSSKLCEVTAIVYPGFTINVSSDSLFEADPANDTILFFKEETI